MNYLLGQFQSAIQSFISGFPVFMLHGAVTLGLLLFGATVYTLLTPHRELALLRAGNSSAGLGLAGVIVGLALPLAECLKSSVNVFDLLMWSVPILIIQLIAFRFVDILLHDLPTRIKRDEAGAAILLVGVKIGVGLITAAAVSAPVPALGAG